MIIDFITVVATNSLTVISHMRIKDATLYYCH
jgi:hypothetical protein